MKVEELMVGDYIKHGFGGIGKVTELSKGIVTVYDKGLDDGEGNCEVNFAENEIQPIPLTPEILEKNGWHVDVYSQEDYDNKEIEELSLWVGVDGENKWWWHAGCELVAPINYVHELQHALKLCGITKEIIL